MDATNYHTILRSN